MVGLLAPHSSGGVIALLPPAIFASEVVVYEVSTGERLRRLGRHKDTPLALGFSPSGEYLATWMPW